MLNDLSSALALLETRRSAKPRDLTGPGPSAAQLDRILSIAARVPDHGTLQPWRFVIVGDEQREALAGLLLAALALDAPESGEAHREKEVNFAHYPGQLVVLVSAPIPNHKIPAYEQELSVGAAAMNMLLGAHALGFVAGWVTGWRAYSEKVRAAFCEPGERIAGFVFIGQPGRQLEERSRPLLSDVARKWSPPAA
ncbi:MAG TPA: nitroreductase [Sphingomicrobium sp.]|nr:nitroreductase [Sphingomicrobium sp.]